MTGTYTIQKTNDRVNHITLQPYYGSHTGPCWPTLGQALVEQFPIEGWNLQRDGTLVLSDAALYSPDFNEEYLQILIDRAQAEIEALMDEAMRFRNFLSAWLKTQPDHIRKEILGDERS